MQPPPRKARQKHSVALKNVHEEQHKKLQHKNHQESELLEDIRNFSKQRSVLEKQYAEALCKLAQQYLSKRQFPPPPNIQSEDGKEHNVYADQYTDQYTDQYADQHTDQYEEDSEFSGSEDSFEGSMHEDYEERNVQRGRVPGRTIMTVWKTVLEETDRVGRTRLTAADTYLQQISDPCKGIHAQKKQIGKKVLDQSRVLQQEISQTIQEMVRAQKLYNDEEHLAHEARVKAREAEEKVRKKSKGLFSSMSSLQKKSVQLNTRKDACESKSVSARNDYLLSLAASNAHQVRYYSTDLPDLLKMLDGEMYESIREFFILFARTELEICGLTQECFTKIMSDAGLISRQYNLQCFMHDNLVFTDLVQYQFEPQDGDEVTKVSGEHNASHQLEKEARKWATKIAKENKTVRDCQKQIALLQEQKSNGVRKPSETSQEGGPQSPVDPEVKIEEMHQSIRKAETGKMKAEARIEILRAGGVNVDEWLNSANADMLAVEEEEEKSQRSSSSMSIKTDSSGGAGREKGKQKENEDNKKEAETEAESKQSEAASDKRVSRTESAEQDSQHDTSQQSTSSLPNDSTYINYQEEDDFIDETFEPSEQNAVAASGDTESTGYSSGRVYPMRCTALYDFTATNSDELTITEGEQLQMIGDGDESGWVKAQKEDGTFGFVPENYVQSLDMANGTIVDENEINVDTDSAPPSAGYSSGTGFDLTQNERVSAYSATDYEVQQTMVTEPEQQEEQPDPAATEPDQDLVAIPDDGFLWVRALYDYEATSEEELSFQEGQLIRILRKDENGVDDGWWEGEVNGKTGVFPSLVVEELNPTEGGNAVLSPVGTGPPPYTPPDLGPPPPQLEITQPTPSDDGYPSPQAKSPGVYTFPAQYWNQHPRARESTV